MMRDTTRLPILAAPLLALACAAPAPAIAQLAHASATTLGLMDNATATARGLAAISVNPAGLGMVGPSYSLTLAPVQLRAGLDPVSLGDLAAFQGELVPTATKEEWLARVAADGSQQGPFGAEVSAFAVQVGRVGVQLSTIAAGRMDLSPDAMEAILYGNAGRTGEPSDLVLDGSALDAFAVTTAGLAVGVPLAWDPSDPSGARVSAGATLKYSVGHAVVAGRDDGGAFGNDPLRADLRFPTVTFDTDAGGFDNGSGFGLDLGLQIERDRLSGGLAVLNVFHTFAWREDNLVFRPGTALLEQGASESDFDARPFAEAPASLRQAVADLGFAPVVAVGGAYLASPDLTISADVRNRFGEGMAVDPKFHAGAGAEYRGLGFLELRGGLAAITGGVEMGGGASLLLGPAGISVAGALRKGDLQNTSLVQLTLSLGGR
jgi:hypothetical protein